MREWAEFLRVLLTTDPGAYWGAALWVLAVLWLVFRFIDRRSSRRGGRNDER